MADDFFYAALGQIATAADFARELRALRDRTGLTVREVARAADVPAATVGGYFSGANLPRDRDQLARILAALGETNPARVEQWQAAFGRVRRLPGRRPSHRTGTPYRGLARFEAADARWFFGREDVTELLASVAATPSTLPLMVVGPSGAGKSSLLRAGLLPRLADVTVFAEATVFAEVTVFEPTPAPVADLKARLSELAAGEPGAGARPAIIVDQFEAVFTLCTDEAERRDFITQLCDLAKTTLVILALRADYYDHAIRYPGLADALQSRQVVLGPMTADQVTRAIIEPARLAATTVEDGLVGLLLADLAPQDAAVLDAAAGGAYEPGALPLLSHALLATWELSRGAALTTADYLASGRIKDALDRTAEEAYGRLSADQQRLARRLFLRLVHVADDMPPSRATVALAELGDLRDADEVLAAFVAERMITVDAGTAQITHDALLAGWPRLRAWIEEGRDGLRTRRRITEGARGWEEAGRESAALWRGSQLAVASDWAADPGNRGSLPALAAEFVGASIAEDAARQRAQRRRTRRLQSTVAALTALVVVVCLLAGYAFEQRAAATSARDNANSREVAIEAGQLGSQDAPLAAQLGVAAYGIARTPQATASLLESTDAPAAARIVDTTGVLQAVALAPDRRLLAAAGADGTLRLWDVAAPGRATPVGKPLAPANGNLPLYTTAFSPNGTVLAAAGAGQSVELWDVSNPSHPVPLAPLNGPTNTIYSVAFSPDGRVLAAASADDTVRLWDVSDPARARPLGAPLTGPTGYAESVAFSASGRFLAASSGNAVAGGHDDTVWVWNVTNPARPALLPGMPLIGPTSLVSEVTFSPSGGLLAAASQDDKIWLWRISPAGTVVQDGTLTEATNWVNTLAFSPNGAQLAAGTSEARLLVWNMATRALTTTMAFPQPVTTVTWDGADQVAAADADGTATIVTLPPPVLPAGNDSASVAYSPDGTTMAVGGTSVELWSAGGRSLIATHPLSGGTTVNGLAFAPAGNLLAVAYSDGTAQLLNAATLAPVSAPFLATARGQAESVVYSPDGATLVTGADDGSVRTWSVTDPAHPVQLADVHDSGASVYTVAFAPDGKTVAAASIDDLTRLWNVTDPAAPAPLGRPLGGMHGYAIGLAFTPDSGLLAIGSGDGTVHLWNVSDPARATPVGAPLAGPTGYVWAAAFSPDGRTLAAGSTDGTVWLWNVADPAHPSLIATLTGPADHVYSVAFSPSGAQLAATSYEGTVHLWDTSPAAAKAAVCANLGQPITAAEWATLVPGVPYQAPCS